MRSGIANTGYLDHMHTELTIGLPGRTYQMRLVFSEHELRHTGRQTECPPLPRIVLFADDVVYHSMSYETIAEDCQGRDAVDWMGMRWIGMIGFGARVRDDDLECDGLFYVGPSFLSALPSISPTAYVASRNAFDVQIDLQAYTDIDASAQASALGKPIPETLHPEPWTMDRPPGVKPLCTIDMDVDAGRVWDLCGHMTDSAIGVVSNVYAGPLKDMTGPYNLCVAPDSVVSYVPGTLFRAYFHGKSILHDNARKWEDLVVEAAGVQAATSCRLTVRGGDMLPEYSISPGHGNLPTDRVLQSLTAAASTRKLGAQPWMREGANRIEHVSRGFDALKLHPHTKDEKTLIVGGNVLWSAAILGISPGDNHAQLVALSRGALPTIFDVVLVIALLFLYLRWKSSGRWTDTCDPPMLYYIVITKVSLVTSFAVFMAKPVVVILYLLLAQHRPAAYPASILPIIWVGFAYDAFIIVLFAFFLRASLSDGFSHIREFQRRVLLVLFNEPRAVKENASILNGSKRPRIPRRAKYRTYDHRSGKKRLWDPRQDYARDARNRHFVWLPSGLYILLSTALDVCMLTMLMLIGTATEDLLLVDIIIAIAYATFLFQVAYSWLTAVTFFKWEVFRGCSTGRAADFLAVAHGAALLALSAVFGIEILFVPLVSRYSTLYEPLALRLALYFSFLTLLLVAGILVFEAVSEIIPTAKSEQCKKDGNPDTQ